MKRSDQSISSYAERGKDHLPRLADAQNVFEHQRRVGE
jgi:hypothetical protein